jgi:polyisoprenoid-binding protein YceI
MLQFLNQPSSRRLLSCAGYAACAWTAAWLSGCASGSGSLPPAGLPGAPYLKDGVFELSPAATTAGFKVAVVDLVSVSGEFRQSSGQLVLGAKGKPQRVLVELKAGSADAGADWINEMLLGPRFFNASQHPSVTFRAENFAMDGERLTEVIGDLTLRGITKPVTLKVNSFNCRQAGKDDGDQRPRCMADASANVKRTDFDMKSWMDSVSESIRIDIKFTAFAAQ